MTLNDFLHLPVTKNFQYFITPSAPDNIPVDFISILEPPVENFVRTNEIILSSALSVRENAADLYQFILDTCEAGAAAIVFAFPDDTCAPLEPISGDLKKLGFPVLTMPWNQLFSDVVESTLKEIWNREQKTQNYLESLQRQLLNYFITGKTLNNAAELLYKYLASDIVILDMNHEVLGKNQRILALSPSNYLKTRTNDVARMEIESGNHLYGHLLMDAATYAITFHSVHMEQYICTPLSLWFDREWSIRASVMRANETFVWTLAHNTPLSRQEAETKAKLLGFKTAVKYACIAADVFSLHSDHTPSAANSYLPISQASEAIMIETVLQSAQKQNLAVMASLHKNRLLIFLQADFSAFSAASVESFLDLFEQNLRQSSPVFTFLWGYDIQKRSMDTFPEGYQNAKKALKLCLDSGGQLRRSCFQLSLIQKVYSVLNSDAEIKAMAEGILSPLTEYDKKKNTDFLDTLKTFLDTNYSVSETSRVTHLHRQSLLYRLEKIEKLCNVHLKNHEDLFLLEIAIRIHLQNS